MAIPELCVVVGGGERHVKSGNVIIGAGGCQDLHPITKVMVILGGECISGDVVGDGINTRREGRGEGIWRRYQPDDDPHGGGGDKSLSNEENVHVFHWIGKRKEPMVQLIQW